jgi:excisionase family DNA binding protein
MQPVSALTFAALLPGDGYYDEVVAVPATEKAMQEFLTIREFSQTYKVSVATTYRLRDRGELTFVKVGRASRIRRADAERWAASLPTAGRL